MINDQQHPSVDSDDPADTEAPARRRTRRSVEATLALDATTTEVGAALPEPGETDPVQDTAEPEVRRRTRPSGTRSSATSPRTADNPTPSDDDSVAASDEPVAAPAAVEAIEEPATDEAALTVAGDFATADADPADADPADADPADAELAEPAALTVDEVSVGETGTDGATGEVVVGTVEVPGALQEPELDVEAEPEGAAEPTLLVRRRRRRRAGVGDVAAPERTEPPLLDTAGDQIPPGFTEVAAEGEAEVVDRALDRVVEAVDARDRTAADTDDADETPADAGGAGAADGEEPGEGAQRRRRRRGGRGRGRRSGSRTQTTGDGTASQATDVAADSATTDDERGSRRGQARDAVDDNDAEGVDEPTADAEAATHGAPSTRLAARGRGRGRTRPGERPAAGPGGRGRRPAGTVSEETRRAIAEAPPKKMLVSVGEKRTQVVVLEERSLVEHYVTRREDVSYVGNIYVGRVQNVLPGMEAAFVDIGKGRNGVLYAGEVNYDEADLEGDLPRIEQTLKPGQTALVQVTKDPMGTKGARLTQQLSIAGRYCVLAPNDGMLGISRKLPEDERERLRKILKTIKPEDYGLIVRTAAEGATREQLEDDVARLVRIWEGVVARAEQAEPLQAVYEEPELVIRVIRDVFGPDYRELVVDDEVLGDQIRGYLADVSPELVDKVSVYSSEEALFNGYEVTNQIRRALEKKVWLASGGYLIVEKTEAMWVIDVNTGKFVGRSNLEETVLKNNLEAAAEIARQLRLRDMGGIIVIDFVDMLVPANRDEVLKRFKRELARDKTKSRVMEISKLGLVQMTRKNVSQGLNESFTTVCDCCDGRGAQIVETMLG